MLLLIILFAVIGAIFGLRFKAYILVPVSAIAGICVAVIAAMRGDGASAIIFAVLASAASLQVGYLCASGARFILSDFRSRALPARQAPAPVQKVA